MKRVAFIVNPNSSNGKYQIFVDELKKKVENPMIHISKSLEDTYQLIDKTSDDIDIYVAVGGDGTISSVAQKLIGTDKILGIYPMGSGNGFSNETNFSKNVDSLINKIQNKKSKKIDTFFINDFLSINVSGVGFDGEVTKEFEKTSRGFKNYIKTSIKTFFKFQQIKLNFIDSEYQKYDGQYLMLNVANTRQFGNNAYIAPYAKIDDGFIDLVLIKKFPLYYSPIFGFNMFRKKLKENKYVDFIKVKEINFSANSEHWHIDGEYKKIKSPIKIKVNPKSLNILI